MIYQEDKLIKIIFIEPLLEIQLCISLGLLSLATILKEKGYDVDILNDNYLFMKKILPGSDNPLTDLEHIAEYIISKHPDILGFTAMCNSFHNSVLLAQIIKNRNSDIKIIFGGSQVSLLPEKVLEAYDWIDLICVGEGESKITDIVKGLVDNNLGDVPGILYRDKGRILRNEDKDLLTDLDKLPFLDYTITPYFLTKKNIHLDIGRGCPFNCIYCSTSKFWNRTFRMKSPERICKEITDIKDISPYKDVCFHFDHDNFTADYNFALTLCEKLEELNINWGCYARVDTLDEKLIKKMASSGCKGIYMGLESGSPSIQKYTKKNLDLENARKIIDIFIEQKIELVVSFIYGFPVETEEDLHLTLNMIYALSKKGIRCNLHHLCVLPATQLFEEYKDHMALIDYCSGASMFEYSHCRSLIEKDRELYTAFYTIKDSLTEKYVFLGKFTTYIINLLIYKKYFPDTLSTIIEEIFKNNIPGFYNDFLINSDGFTDFFKNENYQKSITPRNMIRFLEKYINNKSSLDDIFKTSVYDIFNIEHILIND